MPQVRLSAQPVEEARGASESQAAMSTARRAVGLPRASESRAALTTLPVLGSSGSSGCAPFCLCAATERLALCARKRDTYECLPACRKREDPQLLTHQGAFLGEQQQALRSPETPRAVPYSVQRVYPPVRQLLGGSHAHQWRPQRLRVLPWPATAEEDYQGRPLASACSAFCP